ncbi:MAG: hypothetical protein R3E96_07475 [Planctomycetota bacterium]
MTFPEAIAADDTRLEFLSEALGHSKMPKKRCRYGRGGSGGREHRPHLPRVPHDQGVGGFLGLDAIRSLAHSLSPVDRFRKKELTWHSGYGDPQPQART